MARPSRKLILAFFAAALVLAGCGKGKPNSIVLRYSAWGAVDETKISEASAEEFRKTHPGMEV